MSVHAYVCYCVCAGAVVGLVYNFVLIIILTFSLYIHALQIGFDGEIDEDTISVATLNKLNKYVLEILAFVQVTLREVDPGSAM